MDIVEYNTQFNFSFHFTGKFQSPTSEWIHLTRNLSDYELIVVTEGVLYIANLKNEYIVNKGEYLLMCPDKYQHGYKSSDCSFYWLHFGYNNDLNDAEIVNVPVIDYISKNGFLSIPIQDKLKSPDRMIVLLKQLQDSDKRYRDPYFNSHLSICIITEVFNQSYIFGKNQSVGRQEQIYNDLVDYIGWHICENIRVIDLAAYFNYNEKYLSTFFKKYSGISLKQYILQAKMEHAKASLSDTNTSISQIAYNIGFNDAHNFTNAFKKVTGLSPTEYRTSYSKRSLYYS